MATRNEMAASIWPHLPADRPAPRATPRPRDPLAAAMYPKLASLAPPTTMSSQGRLTFGYEVVPGLRRKGR
jgi:hypothetical protein